MNRFLAVLQVGLALILFVIAASTLVNMILIAMRPETISVVNTLIAQTLIIVCLVALGRIVLKKGLSRFSGNPTAGRDTRTSDGSESRGSTNPGNNA